MTPEDTAKKAQNLFNSGFHCSQAVFAAVMEGLEIELPKEIIAALSPFGGGMGYSGGVCGALSGAVAVIGFIMGKTEPEQKDHKDMWRLSSKMALEFKELTAGYGGQNCRNIARVNWSDRGQVKAFRFDPNSRRKECLRVIGETAGFLQKLLQEMGK
ncbi:MAG: C-GCAxxG-C-C family protein [Dissulfurimicrobium sp.]|uniref:C-GCAxxG-C-C family protein n=1 Tax=Dissulfurimicrobium sp. TaxID=2022436 RepID=UPI0040491390